MKNCSGGRSRQSRRDVMRLALGAGAALALPAGRANASDAGHVKLFHAAPVTLPLWSVTYLAEDMGFYKEEGLTVERIGLNGGPPAMTALLAGEGLANASAPGELLGAKANGRRVKALQSYTKYDGHYFGVSKQFAEKHKITADSSLQAREAALKAATGSRFGITAPGSQSDLFTRMAIKQVNMNPARDYSILPLGNLPNLIAALSANTVDGGILISPVAEQAFVELGVVPLFSIAKGDLPLAQRMQGQVLEARAEDVAARPDVFEKIVRADLKALRVLKKTPDKAKEVLRRTRFAKLREDVWSIVWPNQLATFVSPFVTRESLQPWLESGLVGGNPDPQKFAYDELIDMRFVEAGLKQLGWALPKA